MERHYTIHSQAWWASANPLPSGVVEVVNFGVHADDGGCQGEGAVSWHHLGRGPIAPRIEVFDDGWPMLAQLTAEGFIEGLAGVASTPRALCELLGRFGFRDATPRQAPTTVRSETATSRRADDDETNALRGARVRPLLDAYRTGPLAGEPDDETVAIDLVVDVFHALGDPETVTRVLRTAWGHYGYESGADVDLPASAALVAAVADHRRWLAGVTDEAGEPTVALAEFDADRTDAWRAIVNAALAVVEEAER